MLVLDQVLLNVNSAWPSRRDVTEGNQLVSGNTLVSDRVLLISVAG